MANFKLLTIHNLYKKRESLLKNCLDQIFWGTLLWRILWIIAWERRNYRDSPFCRLVLQLSKSREKKLRARKQGSIHFFVLIVGMMWLDAWAFTLTSPQWWNITCNCKPKKHFPSLSLYLIKVFYRSKGIKTSTTVTCLQFIC